MILTLRIVFLVDKMLKALSQKQWNLFKNMTKIYMIVVILKRKKSHHRLLQHHRPSNILAIWNLFFTTRRRNQIQKDKQINLRRRRHRRRTRLIGPQTTITKLMNPKMAHGRVVPLPRMEAVDILGLFLKIGYDHQVVLERLDGNRQDVLEWIYTVQVLRDFPERKVSTVQVQTAAIHDLYRHSLPSHKLIDDGPV